MDDPKKNFSSYFEGMKLGEAWSGDFDLLAKKGMPAEWIYDFKRICQMKMLTALDVHEFLDEEDCLVSTIYRGQEVYAKDGCFFYPFVDDEEIPDGIERVNAHIGWLNNASREESLQEHACLVASLYSERLMHTRRVSAYLAAIHDIGQKYTAATNAKGELCFRNHAAVSAFIAGHWLRNRREAVPGKDQFMACDKMLVALVYAHMLPKEDKYYEEKFWPEYADFIGMDNIKDTELHLEPIRVFSRQCDKSITSETDEETEHKYRKHIRRGEKIIYECSRS